MARLMGKETGLVAYGLSMPEPLFGHRLLGDRVEAGLVFWD